MVLQHPSSLREATSLCASMGGARIKERCRILILVGEEGEHFLCTSKTEIIVASKKQKRRQSSAERSESGRYTPQTS